LREPHVATFDEAGRLHALEQHWQSRAVGGALPGKDIVDPLALRPWLGQLLLVDVLNSGRDFAYRLYGTNVAETFGEDMTGRSPQGFPPHHVQIIVEPYRAVASDGRPRRTAHIMTIRDRKFAAWERIILPIAGTDAKVAQLLVALHRVRLIDYARYLASLEAAGIVPAITSEPEDAFL
jgi:hypothetical protein